jgi:hypothetical protein
MPRGKISGKLFTPSDLRSRMNKVIVHKNRYNVKEVWLGFDVSADTFSSEIRAEQDHESTLIATWSVAWVTDGTDGKIRLTMDDVITGQIEVDSGFMDIKRVSGGEPLVVLDRPLEVEFRGTVTA